MMNPKELEAFGKRIKAEDRSDRIKMYAYAIAIMFTGGGQWLRFLYF